MLAVSMWDPPIPLETPGFLGERPRVIETTTDAQGNFLIQEGLRAGWYLSLAILSKPYAPWRDPKRWFPLRTNMDLGDLSLSRGVELRGRVLDPQGNGVSDAGLIMGLERGLPGVEEDFVGAGVPLGRTDSRGNFVLSGLAPGPWVLLADADGYEVARLNGMTQEGEWIVRDLEVRLSSGGRITGRLKGRPSSDSGPLFVEARAVVPGSGADGTAAGWVRRARIQPDSSFEVRGLRLGMEVSLAVARGETAPEQRWVSAVEPLVVLPGTDGVQLEWIGATGFEARLVDGATGRPVENAMIFERSEGGWFQVLRLRDGVHPGQLWPGGIVRFEPLDAGPEGRTMELEIQAAGYALLEIDAPLKRGEITDLGEVALAEGGAVSVHVVDSENGLPVPEARVFLANDPSRYLETVLRVGPYESGNWMQFATTDEKGFARLATVQGESVRLAVQSPMRAVSWVDLGELTYDARRELEVELRAGAKLTVQLTDVHGVPVPDAVVEGKRDDDGHFPHTAMNSDALGIATFEHLSPGSWIFRQRLERRSWRAPGYDYNASWRAVELAEGQSIEMKLVGHKLCRLEGRLRDSSGPVAGARLYFEPIDARGGKFPAHDQKGNYVGYQVRSKHDGSFAFWNIVAGDYVVVIEHEARALNARVPVLLEKDFLGVDWVLSAAEIEGQLTDFAGVPLSGVVVRVVATERGYSAGTVGMQLSVGPDGSHRTAGSGRRLDEVRTNTEGQFRFQGLPDDVELSLELSNRFLLPHTEHLGSLASHEVRKPRIAMQRAGVLSFGAPPNSKGDLRVELAPLQDSSQVDTTQMRRAAWKGPMEFGACRTGSWRVQLFEDSEESSGEALQSLIIEVEADRVFPVWP